MTVSRAGLLVAVLGSSAAGAVRFSTDAGDYSAVPGSVVSVQLYLDFDGPEALELLSENGLYGVGYRVAIGAPELGFAFDTVVPVVPNIADFDDSFGPTIQVDGTAEVGVLLIADPFEDDGDTGVVGTEVSVGLRRISLGQVHIVASNQFNAVTSVSVLDFSASTDDTVTWTSLLALDGSIESATFTISTVPGPSALTLLAGAIGLRRRRRR